MLVTAIRKKRMKLTELSNKEITGFLGFVLILILILVGWNLTQSDRIDTLSEHITVVQEMRTCES